MIGVLFRNEEWEYNNKSGWIVRPFRALSVDSVRDGDYQLPKDKPLKNKADNVLNEVPGYNQEFAEIDDEDLPF